MAGEPAAAGGTREAADAPPKKLQLKPQVVRIEVLGDEKVGKTSLICSLVSRHFSEKVPSVLLNVQIPAEESDENVIISITDTSSRVSDLMRVTNAVKRSDAILLVYDVTRPETFQRLRRWLDYIARNKDVPVVLVANKVDVNTVSSTTDAAYASQARQLISSYPFVVSRVECSAKNFTQVAQAFFLAQKAVLYPIAPLYDEKRREVQPKCLKAIKRAFRLYNRDRSGLLSREELNEYQHDCFGMRLLATEMDTMMEFLASAVPDGVSPSGNGIYLDGFIFLWKLFIDRNRPESCWQVLRTLGYNNELHLEIPPERVTLPVYDEDQSAQLSTPAVEFLTNLFHQFDQDKDNKLNQHEIDEVFSICEDTQAPWLTCSPIAAPLLFETAEADGERLLPLSSWLACWSFVAQENPNKLLETLFYLGYNDKAFPAVELVKGRSLTRKVNRIERNVVTCYVVGKPSAAKERLVRTFVGQKDPLSIPDFAEEDEQTLLRAIGAVVDKDTPRYLYITEPLTDDEVELKADVLCIVFDPTDDASYELAEDLDKKLPQSVPHVVLSVRSESDQAASDGDLATEARLKQFATTAMCTDDKSVQDVMALLVSTALRPPKNARAGSSFGLGATVVIGAVVGAFAIGYVKRDEIRDFAKSVGASRR